MRELAPIGGESGSSCEPAAADEADAVRSACSRAAPRSIRLPVPAGAISSAEEEDDEAGDAACSRLCGKPPPKLAERSRGIGLEHCELAGVGVGVEIGAVPCIACGCCCCCCCCCGGGRCACTGECMMDCGPDEACASCSKCCCCACGCCCWKFCLRGRGETDGLACALLGTDMETSAEPLRLCEREAAGDAWRLSESSSMSECCDCCC